MSIAEIVLLDKGYYKTIISKIKFVEIYHYKVKELLKNITTNLHERIQKFERIFLW